MRSKSSSDAETAAPIDGVQTFTGLARDHVAGSVAYDQQPPVGGKHAAQWQNCGWYSAAIASEAAVHSMEHGAVWITYRPDMQSSAQNALKDKLSGKAYVVASPYPDLPTPVVASAWGVQVRLNGADDPRLTQFIAKYANAPTAPEPGGECSGGVGTPD